MGPDLETRVFQWLDQNAPEREALALGYSGGGDSHALLSLAAAWTGHLGVVLHALIVDHGLRQASSDEADQAAEAARRLGAVPHILRWTGEKPKTGVQASARLARHTLLADKCQALGVSNLLLAHTLDDQAETVWMRLRAGGGWRSCRGMTHVGPSPVWPDGRKLVLMRPVLGERRVALREYLQARGESWIDDPSNEDVKYTRIATRQHLARLEASGFDPTRFARWADDVQVIDRHECELAARTADALFQCHDWGGITVDAKILKIVPTVIQHRVIAAGVLAVSGRRSPPKHSVVTQLVQAVLDGRPCSGGGVHHLIWKRQSWLVRDPGEVLGRVDRDVCNVLALDKNKPIYWDGRYQIETHLDDLRAEPLGKRYEGLADRRILETVPGEARAGLLCVRSCNDQVVAIAGLMEIPELTIEPLLWPRLKSRLYPSGISGC